MTPDAGAAAVQGPMTTAAAVDLLWVPLGAGGCSVGWNGRVFERIAARRARRTRLDLYHSALQVRTAESSFTIEMAPAWNDRRADRGVTGVGPVGLRALGRLRAFRYEVRRWCDGTIPDAAAAVGGPVRLGEDPLQAQLLLDLVPLFPACTWGRDEQAAGEMWNSNSLTAWLLARSGHDMTQIGPPTGGRAPGWRAGVVVAQRTTMPGEGAPQTA